MSICCLILSLFLIQCAGPNMGSWKKWLDHEKTVKSQIATRDLLIACGIDSIPESQKKKRPYVRIKDYYFAVVNGTVVEYTPSQDGFGRYAIAKVKNYDNPFFLDLKDLYISSYAGLSVTDYLGRVLDAHRWQFPPNRSYGIKEYWHFDRNGWDAYIRQRCGASVALPADSVSPDAIEAYVALLGLTSENVYGFHCGDESVSIPLQREAIMALLRQEQFDVIRLVLRCSNPEGRAYAAEALMYLDQVGRRMTDEDRRVIEQLIAKNETIRTCGMFGAPDSQSFSELFTPSEVAKLSKIYYLFQSYLSLYQVRYNGRHFPPKIFGFPKPLTE